jgi:hypothetical protein
MWGKAMRFMLQIISVVIACSSMLPLHVLAQEREWQLDAQGEDAFLVFGVPNTTDMGISLWCKIAPVPHNVKPVNVKVALKVDDTEFALKPKFNSGQGNATIEAELEPRDEILAALASTQRIGLHIADHTTIFPTEGANFFEFNKLCTTAPISN